MSNMASVFTDHVAGEIRAELARRKLSQERLSELTGISQSTLSRRLRTIPPPLPFDTDELQRVADALAVSVTAFLPTAERVA
jgi:transcriptional regulator with XRE-family HTH domain